MSETGKYMLHMQRRQTHDHAPSGLWVHAAKQSYGSLAAAIRDGNAFIAAEPETKRRVYVTHVARNGSESLWLYTAETPIPHALPERLSMAEVEGIANKVIASKELASVIASEDVPGYLARAEEIMESLYAAEPERREDNEKQRTAGAIAIRGLVKMVRHAVAQEVK